MTAKEMFEKNNYKLISGDSKDIIQYRQYFKGNKKFNDVVLNNLCKAFWCGKTINSYCNGHLIKEHCLIVVDMELLQAINKQVEELGWNK